MKTLLIVMLTLVAPLFGVGWKSYAQDYIPIFSQDYSSRLSVEIDPIPFLYKGHSLHIRYQPMFSGRFLIGAGAYGMDLPEEFIDANYKNRNEGWEVRIRSAYLIMGELYFKEANHQWFIGEQIGFQSFRVSNNAEIQGPASFNNLLAMTYFGYSWHPYKGSFYVKPWAGIGYTETVDGIRRVGNMEYDTAPWFPFVTFHFGYTF